MKYYSKEYIADEIDLVESVGRPCNESDMAVINVWRDVWGMPLTRKQQIEYVFNSINKERR